MIPNIICIIPARGNSKRIAKKNMTLLNGKPLISYIIATALSVPEFDGHVYVSSEDKEILDYSEKNGATPIERPSFLSEDDVTTMPVLQHAVRTIESRYDFKPAVICLLYATSPMTNKEDIREALRVIENGWMLAKYDGEKMIDSVISVIKDTGHYLKRNKQYLERFYPLDDSNRQYQEPLYRENGSIYVMTYDLLMTCGLIVGGNIGYITMEKDDSVDIDSIEDFKKAEQLMNEVKKEC